MTHDILNPDSPGSPAAVSSGDHAGRRKGLSVLAFNIGVYHTLKFIHIMSAIVWVGGGIFVQIYATKLSKADDPMRLAAFSKDVSTLGQKVFAPASGLVTLMGIIMVIYTPFIYFSETWIIVGLVGAVATFITGAFFIGPTAGKLAKLAETEGPTSPGVQALMKRIFMVSRIDQVVLTIVVIDMVFKPGSKGLP
jgi:uncharacterized membrane protein